MIKNEIRSDFEKGGLRSKRLRRDSTSEIVAACEPSKSTQTFLAEKSAGSGAAKSLSFNLPPVLVTPVVPQSRTLVETSAGIGVNSAAKTPTTCTSSLLDNTYGPMPGGSFSVLQFFVPPLTSTPAAKAKPNDAISTTTTVKLTINYPSKVVEKVLSEEYQAIGKALAFGPPKRLAKAVVKCKALTKHVAETLLNTVNAEVSGLCSRNNPSLLRKCEQSDLKKFSFEALCEEWRERAPLFFAFLMTCCGSGVAREDVRWLPSAAVSGLVLLKQRNPALNATASVLGVLVKTGSMKATLNRMSKLTVTCTNACALKKLDVLGENHDSPLKAVKERVTQENVKLKQLEQEADSVTHRCYDVCPNACPAAEASILASQRVKHHQMACHPGFTIAFDNIDLQISRKNMTMSKQNRDVHWVNHKMFINRVSGNDLPNDGPQCGLATVSNSSFLPSATDHQRQRFNYIVLVSRILVQHFEAFEPLKNVCIQHIPHKHSKEMSQKSTKVPLGIIFKNENANEDMLEILQQFYTYLPSDGHESVDPQLFCGDQLTVERTVNVTASVANGHTPEDRLEGMNFQIGDWHAGVKILSLVFKRFFTGKSEGDCCTLYSDRTLINRRNVKAEPQSAYRPDRDFLEIVIKSRVIAAAMLQLGFTGKCSQPSKFTLPDNLHKQSKLSKLQYLHNAAALIVDKFVFDDKSVNKLLDQILTVQQRQGTADEQPRTANGRFPCRFPGCEFPFRYDGASRRRHEASHNPQPLTSDEACISNDSSEAVISNGQSTTDESGDDVFSYNCALLADGLFFLNFLDAGKEGDGIRLMRQYRYMLLYCRADGHSRNKYALECLFQSFCADSLLSPRDRERFVWNRSVNNRGGRGNNIPHDLEVGHSNLFNKGAIKNLGPNVTDKAVERISYSENGTTELSGVVDQDIKRIRSSGQHTSSSTERDLDELVKRALESDVFTFSPNRRYQHFTNFERDPFKNLDMTKLYSWINQHKRNIIRGNKSR